MIRPIGMIACVPLSRMTPAIHSAGGLSFCRCGAQDSSAVTSVLATSLRLPSLSLKTLCQLGDKRRRRVVGDKVAGQFFGDVLRRRRMPRQIGQHGAALIDAGIGIALAEHRLIARLVQPFDKGEFAAVFGFDRAESTIQPVSTLAKLVTSACV